MENEFIITSTEFAKLIGISNESLRSRRRRGMYHDQYVLKNKSYAWKRPRPNKVGGPLVRGRNVRDANRLSAHTSSTNSISHLSLAKSKRNKNSGNHKHGQRTYYPNKAFELANEFKMIAKAQRKISAAGASEITEDVIRIAEQKHREKLLAATQPIKIKNYTSGIYDCRNEIIKNNKKSTDKIEYWKRYY